MLKEITIQELHLFEGKDIVLDNGEIQKEFSLIKVNSDSFSIKANTSRMRGIEVWVDSKQSDKFKILVNGS